jgi:hypothetical protein
MFGLEKEINAANLIPMTFAYCSTAFYFILSADSAVHG